MDDIRQTAIDRFRAYLERRQFSAHTLARYTLDLHVFFTTVTVPLPQVSFREVDRCLEQQVVAGNPVKPSHFVRRGRPLPKALSLEQVQRLFGRIAHPMDRALFLVILRCGLRVSEVARLKLEQIDWEQQALHIVQGKGRKDRRVYMSPDAVASVQQCLAQHPGVQAQGYVFWNRKRAQQPLSVKAIQKKMERYAKISSQKIKQEYMRTMQKILKQGQV